MTTLRQRQFVRKCLIGFAVIVVLIASAYIFHAPVLRAVAGFLIIQDNLHHTRSVVLLTGDYFRSRVVAGLLHDRIAEVVLIPKVRTAKEEELGIVSDPTSIQVQVLGRLGVPDQQVRLLDFENGVTSTYEEALSVNAYLARHPEETTIILVTSGFHTRRARWIFSKVLHWPEDRIQVAPSPYGSFDVSNWWKDEQGLVHFVIEYMKFGFYLAKYR